MPIIPAIGRRSFKLRLILVALYAILILGSITMICPLLLMLSGSIKSAADFRRPSPLPEYLYDDGVLWQKYLESKYTLIPDAEAALQHPIGSWDLVAPPAYIDRALVDDFRAFRDKTAWPIEWYFLGHTASEKLVAKNARAFRRLAEERFNGNLDAYRAAVNIDYPAWSYVGPPMVQFAERRFTFPDSPAYQIYYELKARAPTCDWAVINLDGAYWSNYLAPTWGNVAAYNRAHGTHYDDYRQVLLSTHPPADTPARRDWEDYVRNNLNLAFIRVDPALAPSFHNFLRARFPTIAELNRLWEAHYPSFDDIPLFNARTYPLSTQHSALSTSSPSTSSLNTSFGTDLPRSTRAQVDFSEFLKHPTLCPTDALSVYGPRQAFAQFRRATTQPESALPIEQADYADFLDQTPALRWEFTKRNYVAVWDYLAAHGNGIRNTVIFCALMVLTNLIVNPLAAYALSRFNPPSTYKILLFCMCTMAFPAEVTMIPSFLLLKRFPLFHLILAIMTALLALAILWRTRLGERAKTLLILAAFATGFALPAACGFAPPSISLLNTFAALILPAAANGFSIFLLKGFFDSLPRDLYEAADIDGAGEWTKFWTIAMSLSKPILAVLALGAFTLAYSEFLMATVIIPDPRMWTLMVWLYQLQTFAHPAIVYASLVIAAIPTLVIFLFAQNLIMRGIVVPVEK